MNTGKTILLSFVLVFLAILTACAAEPAPTASPTGLPTPKDTLAQPTMTESAPAAPTSTGAAEQPEEPSATPEAVVESDRLSLAVGVFSAPPLAEGRVLALTGQVLDTSGAPIPGARVEIWQTDDRGVYDHPGDAGTANRDANFQFYGSSTVDEQGYYLFRTIKPGAYGGRPPHIHVKVFREGGELLTTQFYFAEDFEQVQGESIFAQAGDQGSLLLLELEERSTPDGGSMPVAYKDLVIDLGSGGELTATPRQAEGPYYPVVEVSGYDADLANAQ